jgi:hypothetical protein
MVFIEDTSSQTIDDTEIISLDNPTEFEPSLIRMTFEDSKSSPLPMFTHNFQIKQSLALLIMDNGSQKNLVSQKLV